MIKAGIIGANGYAGQETVRLLCQHPEVKVHILTSRSQSGLSYNKIYGNFAKVYEGELSNKSIQEVAENVDVLFLALPHAVASAHLNQTLLNQTKIIDLGADYRLKDVSTYESWYNVKHESENLIEQATYGLCELNRATIKKSRLIANPGCYATCSILALTPLLQANLIDSNSIIVDAKSGVSGAGRTLNISSHYTECNESISTYKIASHRHTPEIEQQLNLVSGENIIISFTPHLIPMNRGILVTAYANLKEEFSWQDISEAYKQCYQNEYFIRLLPEGTFPNTKWVKGSNFCDINFCLDRRTNRIIVVAALDNLMKGAASQAIQNMNILFGFNETTGINQLPIFPA